jgi:hypothetical protein
MNSWQELVKMALLGTEKMPLQPTILPQNIQNLLANTDASDKESHFLKAAALTLTYQKAGQMPDKTPLPDIAPAADETQPFAPLPYLTVLKKLLDETAHKYPQLYFLLFEKIKQRGYVLPHDKLCSVLTLLEHSSFKTHKTLINNIIGVRGNWLQQFNPNWQIATPKDKDIIWQEGTSAERRAMLFEMRQHDPHKVFTLIQETWASENARERKEFLKILAQNTQAEESDFIQTIYDDLMDAKGAVKTINQDIKELAAVLLLNNATSNLYKSTVERLKKYVSVKKTLLGLQSKTVFTLPEVEDDFFNTHVMKMDFGVSNTPSTNELLTEYWFSYFLQNLHPLAWETFFNTTDWRTILDILEETDTQITGKRKRQRYSFRKYVSVALGKAQYRKAILGYIEKHKVADLSNEELEKFFIQKMDVNKANDPRNVLIRENWRWSSTLSRHILRGLVNDPASVHYNAQFAQQVAVHFDDGILKELYELSNQEHTDWQKQQLHNTLIMPLIQFLELRKEIEKL